MSTKNTRSNRSSKHLSPHKLNQYNGITPTQPITQTLTQPITKPPSYR